VSIVNSGVAIFARILNGRAHAVMRLGFAGDPDSQPLVELLRSGVRFQDAQLYPKFFFAGLPEELLDQATPGRVIPASTIASTTAATTSGLMGVSVAAKSRGDWKATPTTVSPSLANQNLPGSG
jgi:hypothetical protein